MLMHSGIKRIKFNEVSNKLKLAEFAQGTLFRPITSWYNWKHKFSTFMVTKYHDASVARVEYR